MDVNQQAVEVAQPIQPLPMPNGVPNGIHIHMNIIPMNIEGNQPPPPVGFFQKYRVYFRVLSVFLALALLYFYVWLGSFISRNHSHHCTFQCESTVFVSLHGSEKFTSIARAIAMAPDAIVGRYCIIIKSGVYHENLIIGVNKSNIALMGEGVDKTIITSNLSNINNVNATLKVFRDGFFAENIAFEYSDGSGKDATVLLISADEGTFHKCSFRGTHSALHIVQQRHFFRDCRIHGTMSIIYGGGESIFQNCTIFVGQPSGMKESIINLQGGFELNAGFIFQHGRIVAANATKTPLGHTYLASPLGSYSIVTIMRSFMDTLISPAGWVPFNGSTSNKVYYGEFENAGPGANTTKRIHWPGVTVLTYLEAARFTVQNLNWEWLPSTGVPYWRNMEEIPRLE